MEQKKELIRIKLSTIIVIILIILILACGGLYFLKRNAKEEDNIPKQENITETEDMNQLENNIDEKNITNSNDTVEPVEETTQLDIQSSQVQKLYQYIEKFNYYEEKIVYQEKEVTNQTITNQLKLLTIFTNLDKKEAIESNMTKQELLEKTGAEDSEYLRYKKETIDKKAKEIFGPEVVIQHEDCPPADGYARKYKDGIYECYEYQGGGGTGWEQSQAKLLKAEQKGDEIYLYDKYVHLVEQPEMKDGFAEFGAFDIYATSDRKIKIASKINLQEKGVYEGLEDLGFGEEYNQKIFDRIDKITNNKIRTFKHTFKKDSTGNYYWDSTKLLEENNE